MSILRKFRLDVIDLRNGCRDRGPSTSAPIPVVEAKTKLPDSEGFYAWWIRAGALPNVPEVTHPLGAWDLLYVGIAPGRKTSAQTMRSRVVKNHIGGNTGSSTFRLSLASLLFESIGWKPQRTATKVVLTSKDNAELRSWQETTMGLTWTEVEQPWFGTVEDEVIAEMEPPMNLRGKSGHQFFAEMAAARTRFRYIAT